MLVFAWLFVLSVAKAIEVEIANGILSGHTKITRKGRTVLAFESIPYGKPPVGELRFKSPEPAGSWHGKLDATKLSPKCIQKNTLAYAVGVTGQEDCLYLNVYTPSPDLNNQKKLPVMVFFFGEYYISGSADSEDYGPEILLDWDVVLVVPNYRLGPLGFLSTGDKNAPGNFGLKDQSLALKWVQENIEKFGGDPESVTILGQGAGGAAVYLHAISPLSRGSYKRSIIQSGSPLSPWGYHRTLKPAVDNTRHLGAAFGCHNDDTKDLVECLRKIPAEKIVEKDYIFFEWDIDPVSPFRPVIEPNSAEAFMTKDPRVTVKNRNFVASDFILGFNTRAGCPRPEAIFRNRHLLDSFDKNYTNIWPVSLAYKENSINPEQASEKLRQFYFGDGSLNEQSKSVAIDMYTDAWYGNPADYSAQIHVPLEDYDRLYYYVFDYEGEDERSYGSSDGNTKDYGACRKNELFYLFPMKNHRKSQINPKEELMVDIICTLWTNFAIYGNPTPEVSKLLPTLWRPLGKNTLEYFRLNLKPSMGSDESLNRRLEFFSSIADNIYGINYIP